MKRYQVKEIFGPTLQGEGSQTGTPCVFVRFAGCNVWDGRPETKASSPCPYCDTDFRGGTSMTSDDVVLKALKLLPKGGWIVVSGGEPLLQLDAPLARDLCSAGFKLALETNGTRAIDQELAQWISHVTMSPKVPRDAIKLARCDDLKVLVPHPDPGITPEAFEDFPCTTRWIQPVNAEDSLDSHNVAAAITLATDLAAQGRQWHLSVQLHKVLGVR